VDWLSAQSGRSQIILGTRLAVFTPLPNLGLIIVDEEHDASFKQQDGLRYSARDLAVFRAQQLNVPIILGSATPALETFHNALNGRYRLIELPERARQGAGLPSIQCVDTRTGRVDDGLSDKVLQAIEQRLAQKQQSMVFINRRGYAPVLMCGQCGWISACQRCSSRLVLHLVQSQLHCHQCGLQIALPLTCPECGAVQLLPIGHGTQRIEAALHKFFPAARILRFDRDSIRRKHALKTMLDRIHDEDVDILVGTQLLSKGHDFKKLALVAAVNVDSALFSPDFRSTERLFAQLTQVAGRAGRASVDAEVLIQTAFPGHPLFSALRGHDYRAFAKVMLDERRQAGFPPYCYQAILRAEALQLGTALRFLKDAANHSPRKSFPVTVFDPVQAPMPRVSGKWRAHLLIQSSSRKSLQEFLHVWLEPLRQLRSSKVR
jgi:primosomal protein N' (replication factor Y)